MQANPRKEYACKHASLLLRCPWLPRHSISVDFASVPLVAIYSAFRISPSQSLFWAPWMGLLWLSSPAKSHTTQSPSGVKSQTKKSFTLRWLSFTQTRYFSFTGLTSTQKSFAPAHLISNSSLSGAGHPGLSLLGV